MASENTGWINGKQVIKNQSGSLANAQAEGDAPAAHTQAATTLTFTQKALAGRSSVGAGSGEEITIGSGLALSAGSLYATGSSAGAAAFTGLTDTFSTYTGKGTFVVRVNVGETGLEAVAMSSAGTTAWGGITGTLSTQTDLQNALDAKATQAAFSAHAALTASAHGGVVPDSRTINGFALTGNISLSAADVGADASGLTATHSALGALSAHGGLVPSSRTINGYDLSANRTLSAGDVGASSQLAFSTHAALTASAHGGIVPDSRTINGFALTGNITLSAADVGADASGLTATHSALGALSAHGGLVPSSRTINGYDLSANRTLSAGDVGASSQSAFSAHAALTTSAHGGIVPDSRTVGGFALTGNILPYIENTAQQNYHGFVNTTDSTLVWTDSSPARTLTITGTFTYYYKGIPVTVSSSPAVQITNTVGPWYIYFASASGTLTASQTPWNLREHVPVCIVVWNGSIGYIGEERHSYKRNLAWHVWAHTYLKTLYGSGLVLSFTGTGASATFSVTSGTVADEDLTHNISTQTQGIHFRNTGASAYTFAAASTIPFIWNSGTSRAQFVDSTNAYALTDCATNRYFNVWCYASNDLVNPIHFLTDVIEGATGYTSVANARAVNPPSILGFDSEAKLLYRLVVRGDGVVQTASTADDYRTSANVPSGGIPNVTAAAVSYTPLSGNTEANAQAALDAKPNITVSTSDPSGTPAIGTLWAKVAV